MNRLFNCVQSKPEPLTPEPIDEVEVKALNEGKYFVKRQVYNYTKFAQEFEPSPFVGFSLIALLKVIFFKHLYPSKQCGKKQLYNRVPSIKWIKNYNPKEFLLADVLSGLTIG